MLETMQSDVSLLPNLIGGNVGVIFDFLFKLLLIVIAVFVILTWQDIQNLKNILNITTPKPRI